MTISSLPKESAAVDADGLRERGWRRHDPLKRNFHRHGELELRHRRWAQEGGRAQRGDGKGSEEDGAWGGSAALCNHIGQAKGRSAHFNSAQRAELVSRDVACTLKR